MSTKTSSKISTRKRRAKKVRSKISRSELPRLTIVRSNKHISAQLIVSDNHAHTVLVTASSLEKELREKKIAKTEMAQLIGKAFAERASKSGVSKVAFDRAGHRYHGRVKALADAAREGGLEF